MDCVFCKIIAGEIPATKVYETADVLAFLDIEPIEKGHVLVIPKRHWESLDAVPLGEPGADAAYAALARAVQLLTRAVRRFASGANILQANGESAGQTVRHLHFHVIPRYGGGPPSWKSGAAYADDSERAACAEKIKTALAELAASGT